jgi:peptidyl-prolyl cis-trans isomerase B (cyclophilin B)
METIKITTNMGDIVAELDNEKAPQTVNNFIHYINKGHYNGCVFHRVIDGFMIQGGGFNGDFEELPTDTPIENEADNGLTNDLGTFAMARTSDPHSASSQFFINLSDNDFLNHRAKSNDGWGYAVFGKVTEGLSVVKQIGKVATGSRGFHQDVPNQNIVIESVELLD